MTTAKENEVVNIIRAMEAEYMRLMAEREVKQLVTNFYAETTDWYFYRAKSSC
jgi:hypothetical protein